MEYGFNLCRKLFSSDSRKIVDCTLNGKLEIFEKYNFEEYLESSMLKNKIN